MRSIAKSRHFALADFFLAVLSGILWCLFPDSGSWPLLIGLFPWAFRLVAGESPFRRTRFDGLILVFVITAMAGYWAAYDKSVALTKFWFIIASVLLYYALSAQPQENFLWISTFLFCIGVEVSGYFYLTHDFVGNPRKLEFVNRIGRLIMDARPLLNWPPIHPNYVSGIAAITTPFVFFPLWKFGRNINRDTVPLFVIILLGLAVVLLTLFMATSRGVLMAVCSAAGTWLLWRIVELNGTRFRLGRESLFPSLVLVYLCLVIVILYAGPAETGSSISGMDNYGTGSRAELVTRSIYFISDFPFTGGGLGSFPGLYSQYVLDEPFYHIPNGHNVFLDVFIEQGIFGGLAFLILYLAGIWLASRNIITAKSSEIRVIRWITLFAFVAAFVHGLVDDYLYYSNGTILSLFLIGISVNPFQAALLDENKFIPGKPLKIFGLSIGIVLAGICLGNLSRIQSMWYANLGAVQMDQVELLGFPTNGWADLSIVPELDQAESSLHTSLEFDPVNRTANHRLGLISLLQRDFPSAVRYLNTAYIQAPNHRGIIKALGYSYVWLGELDNAQLLLMEIPEAKYELDVYTRWWAEQGYNDLSENASIMISRLKSLPVQ